MAVAWMLVSTNADAVWRCTDEGGSVTFQESPCNPQKGVVQERLEDPPADAGQRGILPAPQWSTGTETPPSPEPSRKARTRRTDDARKKQLDTCKSYGDKLDRNTEKLRQAHKAAKGEKLREERARLKQYLYENCPQF